MEVKPEAISGADDPRFLSLDGAREIQL